ncbi:hypothetical protein JTB14_009192 [Gonioctena quinquepunctata]|nr:hypothetical protein JTB14_009192 [Gonioctena quinquepunctata]
MGEQIHFPLFLQFISFFAFIAVARAGVIGYESRPAYNDAPSVSYSSVSAPAPSYVSPPVYSKVAAPVYAAPTYKVNAPAYKVAAPVAYARNVATEEYTPAHYEFGYGVEDPHTGDVKSHQETREGDYVKGSYSLIEADGSKRIVEYTVDPHSGFNAVVHKQAGAAPAYAKAAPVSYAKAAPVSYAAPIASNTHATPAGYSAVPAVARASYSAAPAVSYSSVSAPVAQTYAAHSAPSYYH